jgi:GTP cyclohydrolase I
MAKGVRTLLEGMGCDLKDPNYVGTPERVARMFSEMLTPQPNNWATFPSRSSDLVVLRNHKVVAICPHHLQPVEIKCFVGYIPHKKTLGISKLARVVEEQLWQPMLQEDLAAAVAESLDRVLEPKGVGVILSGVHGCMRFRGVESDGDVVTDVMKGVFLLNPAARMEFLHIVGQV